VLQRAIFLLPCDGHIYFRLLRTVWNRHCVGALPSEMVQGRSNGTGNMNSLVLFWDTGELLGLWK